MSGRVHRLRLAPSLLSADFADLAGAIRAAEAGGADAFHLDVMDGHFVPNLTMGPALVRAVRARTKLPLDVHLMIEEPAKFVEPFASAGGNTLVFHVESNDDPRSVIRAVHDRGTQVGVAVKPGTPFERVRELVPLVDQVLVMSVEPGFSGQMFLPVALPKLREARAALDRVGTGADLSVDGGIDATTAAGAAAEGATFFVCGNSVFAHGEVADNLKALRQSVALGAEHAVP